MASWGDTVAGITKKSVAPPRPRPPAARPSSSYAASPDFLTIGGKTAAQIQAEKDEEQKRLYAQLQEAMASTGGSGGASYTPLGYGNIYDASGQIANMFASATNGINSAYDTANNQIGEQRGRAATEIGSSAQDFANAQARSNANFNSQQAGLNQTIESGNQQALRRIQADSSPLMADLAAQGLDTGSVAAQLQAAQATASTQGQLQADLSKRLAQVQGQQQADTSASGDLVRQGAEGNLANNYSEIVAKIQSERARELAAAEQARAQAEMQNQQQIAAARSQIDQFNASAANQAASSRSGSAMNPLEAQLLMQEVERGNLDLDLLKKQMAGSSNSGVDINRLKNASPFVASALMEADGNQEEALKRLYATGIGAGMDENTLRGYVQELLTGKRAAQSLSDSVVNTGRQVGGWG